MPNWSISDVGIPGTMLAIAPAMIRLSAREAYKYLALPCLLYIVLFFGGSEIVEHVYLNKLADSTIHWLHLIRGVVSVFFVAVIVVYSLSRAQRDFAHQMESICSLLSAADEGLVAFNADLKVLSFNTRASQLLGGFRSTGFQNWVTVLSTMLKQKSEFEIPSPDGESRLRIVALQSQASGYLLLLQDVTEAKHIEDQWLIAEKMASVGRMAAGLAHEIGTPLNIISGRAELIQTAHETSCVKCGLRENCALEKHTTVIFQQIERISKIIQQLLTQARQTAQSQQHFSLNECVQKVTEFLNHELQKKHVTLQLNLQEDIPELYGFSDQFQQVLINLMTNSMDAVNGTGKIEIITRKENGSVELIVADNGCGIAGSDLTKVFDPFFTTKEFGKGTGLGLTVTANIVRSHGGTINVESKIGRGTKFIMQFPA